MDPGYEPTRILQLLRRTLDAIDALGALRSVDPAAADALRTVRLTRTNLEDHWLPALRDIERSDTMVHWRAGSVGALGLRPLSALGDALPAHLRPNGSAPMTPRRRDELLGQLDFLERAASTADAQRRAGLDPSGAPTRSELRRLGRALAFWVARDDGFADEIVERSTSNLLVGHLLAHATFPPSFSSRVVQQMARPEGPDTNVDHDRYAASLGAVLSSLTVDPGACLELLLDERTAYALASWDALDATILADFVASGLHTAVDDDPSRLGDGYEVLAHLTGAANGPLDEGVNAGMAVGIARALPVYLDTWAPSVSQKGPGDDVAVHDDRHRLSVDFGSYDDLVGLFGALLRHGDARAMVGNATATWAETSLRAAPSLTLFELQVTRISDFTALILDAGEAEQAQIDARRATDDQRASDTGDAMALGVDLLLGARGVSRATRTLLSAMTRAGISWGNGQDLGTARTTGLGGEIHRTMTVTAVSIGVTDPGFFQTDHDSEVLSDNQRDRIEARLDEIRDAPDAQQRNETIAAMVSNLDDTPALVRAVQSITDNPAASGLVGR